MSDTSVVKIPRGQTEARREYMRVYTATHPKRDRRAYKAAYDAANADRQADYRKRNSEHLKQVRAEYYIKHRDRLLLYIKNRTAMNRDKILAYHAAHYQKNAARIKASVAAYRKANPEKKRYLENKRRAKKSANGGSHTLEQRLEKFAALGNCCFYCGCKKPLTVDHDIPLKRGGTDDIDNILPACRSCNSSKNAKTSAEFLAYRTNHAAIGGVGAKPVEAYTGR